MFRHPLLMTSAEGEHHAPIAPLKVRLARAAALFLQQLLMRRAEAPKILITRNNDFLCFRRPRPRGQRGDASYQTAVGCLICHWLRWIESHALKKEPS